MLTGQSLLVEIERFLASGPCSESYFGYITVRDTKLVPRLRAGGTVTLEKCARIIEFIKQVEADGWPKKTPDWVLRRRALQRRENVE